MHKNMNLSFSKGKEKYSERRLIKMHPPTLKEIALRIL